MNVVFMKNCRMLFLMSLCFLMSYNISFAASSAPPIKPPVEQKKAKKKKLKRKRAKLRNYVKNKFDRRLEQQNAKSGRIFSIVFFAGVGLHILASVFLAVLSSAGGGAGAGLGIYNLVTLLASLAFMVGGIGALVIWSMMKSDTEAIVRAAGITFIVLTSLAVLFILIYLIVILLLLGGI
jgi:hypothetical protein